MINLVIQKSRSAWRIPFREKLWVLFLYPFSGLIRLAILTFSFKFLSRYFGYFYRNYQLSVLVTEQQLKLAWRVGKITELVAKYTPWESKCLVQAIMVKTILSCYGIPYVMYIGARVTSEDKKKPMKAHAWIKVGKWIVVGGDSRGCSGFGVVSTFVAEKVLAE